MKRHFAEAPSPVFQKEGCAYATRPLRKHASPLRVYIPVFTPPPLHRRNVGHERNLRSSHCISLPRYRTEGFKISFSGNGLFTIVMHFYIVRIYIFWLHVIFLYLLEQISGNVIIVNMLYSCTKTCIE